MRIALIGCSASKRDGVHPATELYCGHLFSLCKQYCDANGLEYRILSSCYGCLTPDRQIRSYDLRINQKSAREKFDWAFTVETSLKACGLRKGDQVVFLAGNEYFKPLEWILGPARLGLEVLRPLKGKGIGLQKKWLAQAIKEAE